ncbi:MAG: helix-turn-helix domain-containing protein, partial [Nanoarchaeota archaeon]|nr:helix-turn-helix domain-containing protein [Nanoarchaeota archaeon]
MDEERYHLKKLVEKLEKIRGRHTELVSFYVPAGYNLDVAKAQLASEADTASNIKSKTVRLNVISAIEKIISELRNFKKTPENGIVVFAGNVSEVEGKPDLQVWTIIPPDPINVKLYRCDSYFVVEPLKEMLEAKHVYGLIVLDHKDANIALLKGKSIIELNNMHSFVPGKMKAGGQCVLPDTLIQRWDGEIIEIQNINKNERIIGANLEKYTLSNEWCIEKWETKKNKVYKIITRHPRIEIEVSPEHKFFVLTKNGVFQKPARELTIGDYLLTPGRIKFKGSLQFLETSEPYFVNVSKRGRKILREKRISLKKSQREVGKKIGVHQANISQFELGKMNFTWDKLKQLCETLDVDFNNFVKKYCKTISIPKVLNKDLAQIVGYLIGDGYCEKHRITFFEGREEVVRLYSKKLKKLFRETP